jgi:hypothetical protein
MRKIILAASAAIAALSMPVLAQGQGRGQGQGGGQSMDRSPPMSTQANERARGEVQADVRAQTDTRANVRAQTRTGASVDRSRDTTRTNTRTDTRSNNPAQTRTGNTVDRTTDSDRDGIPDFRDRTRGTTTTNTDTPRYGGDVCPPGLAGRDPACVPPGQARQTFSRNQVIPDNYRYYRDYAEIPTYYQDDITAAYRNNPAYRYIYTGDRIYVVDRTTSTVIDIINNLVR